MRLRFFFLHWVNDIRLLVQYRQYSHRRLLSLLGGLMVMWIFYKIGCGVSQRGYIRGTPVVDHWCEREELPEYFSKADPEEVTIVTAFFNLGSYRNGPSAWDYSNPYQLKQRMRPLGRMANPVVAYIEDEEVAEYFRQIRACLPPAKTLIIRVRREELWSFGLRPYIDRIYGKPGYPRHHPNTAYPDHTCVSHAKYELLQMSVEKNPFKTPFFAWMDVGYFGGLDQTRFEVFKLVPPATYNEEMVAMSHAYPHDPNIPAREVIAHNLVWVSGEMVLGLAGPLSNFTRLYKDTVHRLLKDSLSAGDEQIIYLMYSTPLRRRKQVMIKTYMCQEGQLGLYGRDSRFLCLGYVCRNTWNKIHKPGYN